MSTTYERLKKLVVEQLGVEEEFGTEISDEDAEKIRTVQDAVDYIDERST